MSTPIHEIIDDPFINRPAEIFRAQFELLFEMSDLEVPIKVVVERAEENVDSANQFPALTRWHNGDAMTVLYDKTAVFEAVERHSEDPEVMAHVERLYIAGGIALGILNRRVSALDSEKTILLYTSFKDTAQLQSSVVSDNELDGRQQEDLALRLVSSTEQRLLRIGVQRFIIGLCQQLPSETLGLNRLYEYARSDIKAELDARFKTSALLIALQFPNEEVALGSHKALADNIPELSISLSYPMNIDEIQRILQIVTLPDIEDQIVFDGSSIEEVPPFGFHEEDGPL